MTNRDALADWFEALVPGFAGHGIGPIHLSPEQRDLIVAALRSPPVTTALELAKNIIFGSQFAATRERNYAKAAEYQSYIDTIDAALSVTRPDSGD